MKDYTSFGRNIGNIVTDLFYHNPSDDGHWKAFMSQTVSKPGITKKISDQIGGKYNSLQVYASNPNGIMGAMGSVFMSLMSSLEKENLLMEGSQSSSTTTAATRQTSDHAFTVTKLPNQEYLNRQKFMNRGPLLRIEDKDMPIRERLQKTFVFKTRT